MSIAGERMSRSRAVNREGEGLDILLQSRRNKMAALKSISKSVLYLTDRRKNMILSGGENIAASAIERVFYEHDAAHEAVAIGLADDRWGECLVAVVVVPVRRSIDAGRTPMSLPRPPRRLPKKVVTVPKELHLRPALPRNPSGKVLERLLHEELAGRRGA